MAIRHFFRGFTLVTVLLATIGFAAGVSAAENLKPFILASTSGDDLQTRVAATKEALADEGFTIVGEYSPIDDTVIVIATDNFLKDLAEDEKGGPYFAAQRISVSKVGERVQVSYANPEYWSNAYRIRKSVTPVTAKLSAALGSEQEFGSEKGLSPRKLKKYHYTFGMEYFDDELKLADYGSQSEAVREIERNLANNEAGVSKVYRIDMGGDMTVFGVHMTEGFSADKTILEKIDVQPLKHAAHFPYEVVVSDGKVRALSPRFRIAIAWPDLKMVGDHSFFEITKSPGEIEKVLTLEAGGKLEKPTSGGFNVQ